MSGKRRRTSQERYSPEPPMKTPKKKREVTSNSLLLQMVNKQQKQLDFLQESVVSPREEVAKSNVSKRQTYTRAELTSEGAHVLSQPDNNSQSCNQPPPPENQPQDELPELFVNICIWWLTPPTLGAGTWAAPKPALQKSKWILLAQPRKTLIPRKTTPICTN